MSNWNGWLPRAAELVRVSARLDAFFRTIAR
jgi:hypothetical protein